MFPNQSVHAARLGILKRSVLTINLILTVVGIAILILGLRLLFDADFSYLLYHGTGSYFVGYLVSAIGLMMCFIGFTTCYALFKSYAWLLNSCCVIEGLFVMAKISIGVLGYTRFGEFQEKVHFGIFWAVQRHYGHDISNTTIIDWIQQGWHCCGLNSYTSWSNSLFSKRHVPKETYPTNTFIVPKSCCIDPNSDTCEALHLKGLGNAASAVFHDVLHPDGCGPKVMNVTNLYANVLLLIGVGLVSLEAIAIFLTLFYLKYFKKKMRRATFTNIKSQECATLLASDAQNPGDSPKAGSPSIGHSYAASRSSLPVSSVV